jgi:hypothetical protein
MRREWLHSQRHLTVPAEPTHSLWSESLLWYEVTAVTLITLMAEEHVHSLNSRPRYSLSDMLATLQLYDLVFHSG